MGQKRYEMSDEQWEQIKDLFTKAKNGRPPKYNRLMFNAILWLARSGSAWRDLPERFGSWKTVYSRFSKWCDECFFNKIKLFRKLATRYDKLATSFLAFIYCAAIFILCK